MSWDHLVDREDNSTPGLLQLEAAHFLRYIDRGILVIDFADENGLLVRVELVVERPEQ